MSNQTSKRLKQNAERIMQRWEERARDEVGASIHQDSLMLQNSLPKYLEQLVDELSTKIERTPARIKTDKLESTRMMIQNLLDASRLRAGQSLKFKFEECNLDSLVQDVVEDLNFTYGERFIVVSDNAIRSNCSRKEIRRVIENLAINAVKYGAANTPITLTLEQIETHISLTIHNEGNPISSEAQSILFQQFRRTISAEDQTKWGLGLFLAKSIIEAHQGTIEVESAQGKGISFIIKLPKVSY
ncbi:MAG: HAMP domain-containing sensor histidine kinase [Nostoc sp.]